MSLSSCFLVNITGVGVGVGNAIQETEWFWGLRGEWDGRWIWEMGGGYGYIILLVLSYIQNMVSLLYSSYTYIALFKTRI